MTFIQWEFLAFFGLLFGFYWLLPRRGQNLLLAGGSALFYGWVHPWFLCLLYGSAVLDYSMGLAMRRWPEKKGLFLTLSLAGNLGLLGTFKYFDFFVQNLIDLFTLMGVSSGLHTLGIFLPVGISFYTFQTMSYSLDIYRGQLEPRRNFLDYVVFVSFFPQLVAGPVERARNLLPQMEVERVFRWEEVRSGLALALWGGFKKVCVADVIAPYVDKAFALREPSGPLIWAATLGFAIQILADFSGYTDIARGTARMLGIRLMKNFDHPYLATSPSEFWRRWHISFSSWIRDYLYIAAGGSRGGFWYVTRNTFLAMLLSGLWHGAAWTFVLWGAYHALLLTGYRLVGRVLPESLSSWRFGKVLAVGLMFFFTTLGWMIFRQTRLEDLLGYFTLNPFVASPDQWVATVTLLAICALVAAPLLTALWLEHRVLPRLRNWGGYAPLEAATLAALACAILTFVRSTANDFIYFQF